MNSSFTIEHMIEAKNKMLENRRDQVMGILNGFASDLEVKREDITLDTVVVVSSLLSDEYPYLKEIPFIHINQHVERNKIFLIENPYNWLSGNRYEYK